MNTHININSLNVNFYLYGNKSPSLKEALVRFVRRKGKNVSVFQALKGVNLNFSHGERIGVIGRNGAGKSTLLKVVTGIYPPSSGEIEICGDVVPLLELGAGFDLDSTTRENIFFNGALLGLTKKEMQELEEGIIEFSELGDFMDNPLKSLSSGMRGRLAFSIATSIKPEILILDEVFAAGDAKFIKKARARMFDLIDSCQILLFVSHREELVKELCERVVVLDNGEVVMEGSPDEAYEFYNNNIVKI